MPAKRAVRLELPQIRINVEKFLEVVVVSVVFAKLGFGIGSLVGSWIDSEGSTRYTTLSLLMLTFLSSRWFPWRSICPDVKEHGVGHRKKAAEADALCLP